MKLGRADIREQVGIAVNASCLIMREIGGETALDRVAGLGAAAAIIASGLDRTDDPLASANGDLRPRKYRDVIEAELAPMLWHLEYGRQVENAFGGPLPELIRAIALFAFWLEDQAQMRDKRARLRPFSARILYERLSTRCISCGGTGKQQRLNNGSLIRPLGSMQRNAVYAACRGCGGSGRQANAHAERARSLGVTGAEYNALNWPRAFMVAHVWVDSVARRIRRPLTAELERRKRHSERA